MIAFISVNVAFIVLRKTQSIKNRPFKVPLSVKGIPLLPVLAIGCCLIFLFQFERQVHLIGLVVLFGSAGIYFLCRVCMKK